MLLYGIRLRIRGGQKHINFRLIFQGALVNIDCQNIHLLLNIIVIVVQVSDFEEDYVGVHHEWSSMLMKDPIRKKMILKSTINSHFLMQSDHLFFFVNNGHYRKWKVTLRKTTQQSQLADWLGHWRKFNEQISFAKTMADDEEQRPFTGIPLEFIAKKWIE